MLKRKRKNLSKDQIKEQMEQSAKVEHLKDIARRVLSTIDVETIYDAQTTVAALAGFIAVEIEKKVSEIPMSSVEIDLSSEDDTKITDSMKKLIEDLKDEPAQELSETLERIGDALQSYSTLTFMKKPFSELNVDDIVKK